MKVLVTDDEALARTRLIDMLRQMQPPLTVAGEACNGLEALRACLASKPDVVLLDIRMPVLDGIGCARELAKLPEPPAVIFTTAYDDYALDAFEVAACDYLLKPVRQERLAAALGKAQRFVAPRWQRLEQTLASARLARDRLCAYLHGEIRLIPVDRIRYFRADQKYTTVRCDDGETLIEDSLKSLEEEFRERFLRVHRNTLVALPHVTRLERHPSGTTILVLDGIPETVEISRRCLPEVRERLKA
ncbi:MAG: response regulator transcription factor [Methylococcaceae bacterium]|nr:response regulator transcription factor [Methylococcaceae bacterium]